MRLFIDTTRDGYEPGQVRETMTLDELIEALSVLEAEYGEDVEVLLRNDGGYTYGGITEDGIRMEEE